MSKLNKANNTSIFFDEILASFRPFILLVLDCSYKKPYILPPKVFILWRYFLLCMHVFILTNVKMRSLRYKISNNPKRNDVLSCSFKYIVFSQRKMQGLKVLLQLFNN